MLASLDPIHRRPSVERLTGLKRSAIYDAMSKGNFPKPVKLGPKAVGWRESDLAKWLAERSVAA
ncbi:helix-turn-helix transcriptional regulator [Rhizobium rhizogenes]|uniref:helix-turn-helix transcriptional regulator n=1 Tax=Rhizobium rhizogenes TaxID=359 RepID=UPI001572426E|nr:AlpA family phage regulatory protein [Rhizobium rhizogenes]NTI35570.1 AlpA family phage regulatory protein [Rhizobium rhizogenes]WEO63547.1 AlpA family phage regulatory protein [Rhizobium rhizogenes]